jgi:hypothetical protein
MKLRELENICSTSMIKNELSGVITIDEQFPMVNGEKKAKSVVMDLGTNI